MPFLAMVILHCSKALPCYTTRIVRCIVADIMCKLFPLDDLGAPEDGFVHTHSFTGSQSKAYSEPASGLDASDQQVCVLLKQYKLFR
jgi:hypothetical protein